MPVMVSMITCRVLPRFFWHTDAVWPPSLLARVMCPWLVWAEHPAALGQMPPMMWYMEVASGSVMPVNRFRYGCSAWSREVCLDAGSGQVEE